MSDARDWFDETSDDIIRLLHAPECEDERSHKALLTALVQLSAAYAFSGLDTKEHGDE